MQYENISLNIRLAQRYVLALEGYLLNFADLHELLRLELVRRIEAGTLTGTRLARQTGFRQAHISNFLNRKRSLSLEGLDRVLAAQSLTVDQILPVDLQSSSAAPHAEPAEGVPLVSPSVAMLEPRISPSAIIETIPISSALLYDNRPRPSSKTTSWQRFVAIRIDNHQATAMEPLLKAGSIAVIDRHYNSLAPYRPPQANVFAVRCGSALLLRFVDLDDNRLILRPHSMAVPVQLMAMQAQERPADFIIGRACLIFSDV